MFVLIMLTVDDGDTPTISKWSLEIDFVINDQEPNVLSVLHIIVVELKYSSYYPDTMSADEYIDQ